MKKLELEKMTLGEIAMVEELGGQSIASVGEDNVPMGKMLAALAMVAKRRDGFPTFKFGDALAMTMEEAQNEIGWDDDEAASSEDGAEEPAPTPTKASKGKSPTTT